MPSPMKRHANRCGVLDCTAAAASAPKSFTDSSQGNAMVHPRPWSIIRRDICLATFTASLRKDRGKNKGESRKHERKQNKNFQHRDTEGTEKTRIRNSSERSANTAF